MKRFPARRAAHLAAPLAILLFGAGVATPAVAVPPVNDNYIGSTRIHEPNQPVPREPVRDAPNTAEATTQPDLFVPGGPGPGGGAEPTDCNGVRYGKTVWYDFTPDERGVVGLRASNFQTVVALYEFDPRTSRLGTRVGCEARLGEELFADVRKDRNYTVQVGGADLGAGPAGGGLLFNFEFFQDRDGDNAFEPDIDKCPTLPGTEAGCPPRLDAEPPILRAVPTGNGIRVQRLTVTAPRGSRIEVKCSKRCRGTERKTVRGSRPVTFRRLRNRSLRSGAAIDVRITRKDHIGRYTRFNITRGNFKRQNRCLLPGSRKPRRTCR